MDATVMNVYSKTILLSHVKYFCMISVRKNIRSSC